MRKRATKLVTKPKAKVEADQTTVASTASADKPRAATIAKQADGVEQTKPQMGGETVEPESIDPPRVSVESNAKDASKLDGSAGVPNELEAEASEGPSPEESNREERLSGGLDPQLDSQSPASVEPAKPSNPSRFAQVAVSEASTSAPAAPSTPAGSTDEKASETTVADGKPEVPRALSAEATASSAPRGNDQASSVWFWILAVFGMLSVLALFGVFLLLATRPMRQAKNEMPELWLMRVNGAESTQGSNYIRLVRKTTMVGRLAPNAKEGLGAIVLPDKMIGRRHALLEFRNHRLWISDLNSANGTFVNDRRLGDKRVGLSHGDKLRFANVEFEFVMSSLDDASATIEMQKKDISRLRKREHDGLATQRDEQGDSDVYLDFDKLGLVDTDASGKSSADTESIARQAGDSIDRFFAKRGYLNPKKKRSGG